ncbi:MAG: hypothetical protein J5J00_07530 [Deltaproteobacteria bacterium]|nr:hypothetical protein [Deltaproteobacteria bacterium]
MAETAGPHNERNDRGAAPNQGPHPGALEGASIGKVRSDPLVTHHYDASKELAQVLVHGINHSIIHNAQDALNVLSLSLMIAEDELQALLPASLTACTHDPRAPGKQITPWNQLNGAQQFAWLAKSLTEFSEIGVLRGEKNYELDSATSFFVRFKQILNSMDNALEQVPQQWRSSEVGGMVTRGLENSLKIISAQVDMALPPKEFPLLDLKRLAGDAAELVTEGQSRFPKGFIRTGEFPKDLPLVRGQYDLLLRSIAECAKNSYQAAFVHERAVAMATGQNEPSPEAMKEYYMSIGARVLPDGRVALELTDNAHGIPPKYLEDDKDGVPGRPYLCNRTASSKGGGIGCCELYHIVRAHGGELQIENYSEGSTSGARISIILPKREANLQQ